MKTLIIFLLAASSSFAQLPKLGTSKDAIYKMVDDIKYPVTFDSVMFDKRDIEGNEIVQSYSIYGYLFYGMTGEYSIAFDRKGKSTLNEWSSQNGTIESVKALRDSISIRYKSPKHSFEGADIIRYEWSSKPVHALSLKEGEIKYYQFK